MDKIGQNPLARLDRQKTNYPLIAAAGAMAFVLLLGFIMSLKDWNLTAALLFFAAGAVFVVVVLVDIAARRRIAAVDDRKFIDWVAELPELQRQNATIEVRELARLLRVGDEQLPELFMAYVVACDLALRQIQQEENLPLMRHVSIGKSPFDGMLVDQDLITCIEVTFLVTPNVRQDRVESMLKKVAQAKKNLADMKSRLHLRLMLVLVTQLTEREEEDLRSTLGTKRFSDTPVDIDIRLLDFEMLQKLYLSE
ncbi:MAG: hypothetical protein IPL32_12000 [Chloracidobacterium sp.]|nr:hypothetical protein [Chloracidobacterium sp.]